MSAYVETLVFDRLSFSAAPLRMEEDGKTASFAHRQNFDGRRYELALPATGGHTFQVTLSQGKRGERHVVFSLYDADYVLVARKGVVQERLTQASAPAGEKSGAFRLSLGLRMGVGQILREELGGWFEDRQSDFFGILGSAVSRGLEPPQKAGASSGALRLAA